MRVQITLDFDITKEGLEDNQAHVAVIVKDDAGEVVRGQDWYHNIDVDHDEPLRVLLAEVFGGSWVLSSTNSDILDAIKKFTQPQQDYSITNNPRLIHDWADDEIPF